MPLLKHKNVDEQLIDGLSRALSRWQAKTYLDSEWRQINEERRDRNIRTITSLINYYNRNGNLTQGQRELAKKLIDNSNKR